jgi:hypothetical protein
VPRREGGPDVNYILISHMATLDLGSEHGGTGIASVSTSGAEDPQSYACRI